MQYNNENVGSTIRKLRLSKGLSQDVLSGLSNIVRSHLSMIETGTKRVSFETIWKIAIALDMKPSELVAMIEKEGSK